MRKLDLAPAERLAHDQALDRNRKRKQRESERKAEAAQKQQKQRKAALRATRDAEGLVRSGGWWDPAEQEQIDRQRAEQLEDAARLAMSAWKDYWLPQLRAARSDAEKRQVYVTRRRQERQVEEQVLRPSYESLGPWGRKLRRRVQSRQRQRHARKRRFQHERALADTVSEA